MSDQPTWTQLTSNVLAQALFDFMQYGAENKIDASEIDPALFACCLGMLAGTGLPDIVSTKHLTLFEECNKTKKGRKQNKKILNDLRYLNRQLGSLIFQMQEITDSTQA